MAEILNAAPWGITDPNGYVLFPVATKASADLNAPADADVEVDLYKDAGVGHFVTATGWTHLFTLVYTDTTGNGKGYAMGYSNNLGDFRTHKNNGWPGCCLLLQSDGGGMVDVEALTDGGNTGGGGVAGMFDENVVVYGKTIVDANNFTVEFYSDAARTNLIGSDSIAHGAGEPATYQYLHAMTNQNRGSTGREWGFDIYDIDLQEGPPSFVTATLQSSSGVALTGAFHHSSTQKLSPYNNGAFSMIFFKAGSTADAIEGAILVESAVVCTPSAEASHTVVALFLPIIE